MTASYNVNIIDEKIEWVVETKIVAIDQHSESFSADDWRRKLLRHRFLLYELTGFFARDASYGAHFLIIEQHSIELVRIDQHLGSEGSRDELGVCREFVNHC